MIKSMTGFGRGEADSKFGKIVVELRTLNHRFFELSSRLPENCLSFEEKVKSLIQKGVHRGKVILLVSHQSGRLLPRISVDKKTARNCYEGLNALKKSLGLKGEIELSHLLSFPNLIQYEVDLPDSARLLQPLSAALKSALKKLIQTRQREGELLYNDFAGRCRSINASLTRIEKRLPKIISRHREKLRKRLDSIKADSHERIEIEVSSFSKNCDISEEITRMKAHLKGFEKTMLCEEEAGKKLDFIAQELHREATTIGSKACDYHISSEVIQMKSEIEKIREQVQNIE